MSKKKVLIRGVFINRDTNGEGVLKVGTTLIRVSTVMGILYMFSQINEKVDEIKEQKGPCLWCDATDTCADLGCVFCDGLADDFVG